MSPTSLAQPASISNRRVRAFHSLPSPAELIAELPLSQENMRQVERDRSEIADIVQGKDDRLLVIVGPCSIHDPEAAHDYATRLAAKAAKHADELKIVMRVYFEKPRTTVGWKGLINDPNLDGTFHIRSGLRTARGVLRDVLDQGLPAATEFLEPSSPQYIADAVAWGAIGARTTESQVHRQLASGLSMPIGFKNGTDGGIQMAIDGVGAASHSHAFFGLDDDGNSAVVETAGNPFCHVILRGGSGGPNYDEGHVAQAIEKLTAAGLHPAVMIDASHANSGKDDVRQKQVIAELAQRISAGNSGINGIMIESFLRSGAQKLDAQTIREKGKDSLVYGQSVTDKCIDWDSTVQALDALAAAVAAGRRTMGA